MARMAIRLAAVRSGKRLGLTAKSPIRHVVLQRDLDSDALLERSAQQDQSARSGQRLWPPLCARSFVLELDGLGIRQIELESIGRTVRLISNL